MLGPQFSDYGPYFVDGLVAVVLTLLSLAQARKWQSRGVESRSALERSQKSDHRPSEFLELNLNLFMRLTAETSAWGAIFVLYIVVGPIRMTSPPSNVVTELCRHDDLILSIFWSVLLGISLVRLSRLPFRRQAFALALLNLRQLAAGYVLAASLLYAVTGLANIYVVERFDAAYQTYLQVGQNPTLRHQLGL